jgi:hypothetical protein
VASFEKTRTSKKIDKWLGIAFLLLALSACAGEANSIEESPSTNSESETTEAAPTGFLDLGRYSELELAAFRAAFESVELEFDEFDEVYTSVPPVNGGIVAEVEKSGEAALLQMQLTYGKNDSPEIVLYAYHVGEDWTLPKKLQIRSMEQTFEFQLGSSSRDVISGSLVSEIAGTDPLDEDQLEFLYLMTQDSGAKARLSGESSFDWDISEFDKVELSKAIDAYRHLVLVEFPKS